MEPPSRTPLAEVIGTILGSAVAVSLMLGLPYFAKEWRYGDLYETQENSERHKDTESRTCPPPPRGEVTGCDINKRDRNMELKKNGTCRNLKRLRAYDRYEVGYT